MRKPLLLTMVCLFASYMAFASFPVQKERINETSVVQQESVEDSAVAQMDVAEVSPISPAVASGGYNMWIAAALCWFLGIFAAHRWYAKKSVGVNILFILTLGGLLVWWLIDLIRIFTGDFES